MTDGPHDARSSPTSFPDRLAEIKEAFPPDRLAWIEMALGIGLAEQITWLMDEAERLRSFRDGFLKLRAVLGDAKRRSLVPEEAITWEGIAKALIGEVERLRQERDDLALRLADMAIAFAEMKAEHE